MTEEPDGGSWGLAAVALIGMIAAYLGTAEAAPAQARIPPQAVLIGQFPQFINVHRLIDKEMGVACYGNGRVMSCVVLPERFELSSPGREPGILDR